MEWLGDTEEVKKLINELLKSEDLINVYSEDYFQKKMIVNLILKS